MQPEKKARTSSISGVERDGQRRVAPGKIQVQDRATRLSGTTSDRHPATDPSTFHHGFLDRHREKAGTKPTHDFI